MGNPLRIKTLASAVGIALVGLAFQPSAQAGAMVTASAAPVRSEALQSYLITFAEAGLVSYRGEVEGLAATAPRATHSRKLDAKSPAAIAYAEYLLTARLNYIAAIQGVLGHEIAVTHHYGVTRNGIAADLSASEAAAIAAMPGVVSVKLAGFEQLVTYRGPTFIGANTIWDGSNTPTNVGTKGEGVVTAILDGGTNSSHPSFANDTACGFSAANPKLAVMVDCQSTNAAGECTGTNPEANPGFGHGVHTSSTVAGNTIDNSVTPAPSLPDGVTMSGVAPCATIHHYKVCATNSCAGNAIVAGIDNAILDGADVLNFSISGGTSPWVDNDRGFLDAVEADIFVAASAGNNSQTDPSVISRVNHRGPWVMTVAASTQDQIIGPSLSMTGPGTPPAEIAGIPLTPGSTTPVSSIPSWTGKPVKTYTTNIEGCTASGGIAAGTFAGSIAVLSRGTCPFAEKIQNAYDAGAEMVVIANNQPGSISMDTTGAPNVPAFSIGEAATGAALIAFLDANSSGVGDVDAIAVGNTQGDVLADFSYRGPTPGSLADLTKPDITAPGVNIYAATDPVSGQYQFMSGTSMSGPHVAGAAALVRGVHPDWTVTEVKSAMMTTTKTGGFQEDGSTSWNIDDVGSGRVDLTKAALAGFTMDESIANYLAANPSGGSINVKDLNLPAVRNMNCSPDCTFTRKVTNRLSTSATWNTSFEATAGGISATVSPATFTLAPDATQELTITVRPPYDTAMSAIGFGFIHFDEANGQSPQQHFSVAIKGTGGSEPEPDDVIFADGFDGEPEPVSEPFSWVLDDGTYENAIGWTDEDGLTEFASLWLNRFSPDAADFPLTLENVEIMWPVNFGGSMVGENTTILVYLDADADGDPSNAELLTSVSGVVAGEDAFQSFTVDVQVPTAGDVYIGFEDTWADGGVSPALYPGAIDDSSTALRSYIVANDSGATPDKDDLSVNDYVLTIEDASGGAFTGAWMIRGNGQTLTGKRVELKN